MQASNASIFPPRAIFFGTKNREVTGRIEVNVEQCPFGKTGVMEPKFGKPSKTHKEIVVNKNKHHYVDLINIINFS